MFVVAALDALSVGVIVPALPPLVEALTNAGPGAAAMWITALAAAWGVAQFLAAPLMGALADRYGRRPVLLASLAGLTLDTVLMTLAPSLAWLLVGRLLSGAFAASIVACTAYVLDVSPPAERARQLGLLGSAWSAGFVLGPALGGALAELHLRLPFLVCSAFAAAAWLLAALRLPESLPPERRARAVAWRQAAPFVGIAELFRRPALRRPATILTLALVADQALPTFFALYTLQRYGWSPSQAGLALMALAAGRIAVLGYGVQPVTRRIGSTGTLQLGFWSITAALFTFALAPSSSWFWMGLPLYAIGALAAPTLTALMADRVEPSGQGRLQGASSAMQGAASGVAPVAIGAAYALTFDTSDLLATGSGAFLLAMGFSAAAAVGSSCLGLRAGRERRP